VLHEIVRPCDLREGNFLSDLKPRPSRVQCIVQISSCRDFRFDREIIAPEAVQTDILKDHLPERNFRCRNVGSVCADRAAHLEHLDIGVDISPERHFDDMVDAIGSEGLYTLDQPLIIENDFVSARRPPGWLLRRRAHRPDHARAGMSRKRDRAHTNSAAPTLFDL
jgi:hypothetical protein